MEKFEVPYGGLNVGEIVSIPSLGDFRIGRGIHENSDTRARIFHATSVKKSHSGIIVKHAPSYIMRKYYEAAAPARDGLTAVSPYDLSRYLAINDTSDPFVAVALNYIPGDTLSFREILDRPHSAQRVHRVIDETRGLVRIVGAIMEGGMVHRDIAPRNVLVTPEGKVAVIDPDFLRPCDSEDAKEQQVGNLFTISPEIARRCGATRTSDMYSAASTAFLSLADPLSTSIFDHHARVLLERKTHGTFLPENLADEFKSSMKSYPEACHQALGWLQQFILRSTCEEWEKRPQSAQEALAILNGRD